MVNPFDLRGPEFLVFYGCLGAAVMMRWGTLPTKIQRELFESATSIGDLRQTAQTKGQIARFLHLHKKDGEKSAAAIRRRGS